MDCNEAKELMDRLLSDDLNMEGMQALWEHAAGCAECGGEMERLSRFIGALEYKPTTAPPEHMVRRIMAAVEPASPPKRGFLPDAIQVLFAALVLALVGSLYPLWQGLTAKNVLTRLYFRTVEDGFSFIATLAHRVAEAFGRAGLFAIAVMTLVAVLVAVELTLRFAHRGE